MIVAAGVAGYQLTRPRVYASESSFLVEGPPQGSPVSGLAAQVGLVLPNAAGDRSPAFFVELLQARPILARVAGERYGDSSTSQPLAAIWRVRGTDSLDRLDKTIARLRSAITASRARETGTITVSALGPTPIIARQLLDALIAEVNQFNLDTRRTRATNERRFTEQRVNDVRQQLHAAESALEGFLAGNRGPLMAPELTFQHDKLAREVSLLQQLYTTLSQNYEQARIDEVRDTPAISVIEPPTLPSKPQPRRTATFVATGFLGSLAAGCALAVIVALCSPRPETAIEELQQFQALRRTTAADIRRPWRFLDVTH